MNKYTHNPLVVAIVSISIMVAFFLIFYKDLPPQVPLFFSLKEGDTQIGDLWMMIIFPVLTLLFLSFHELLSRTLFRDDMFIKTLLRYSSIVSSILFCLICIKIILLIS